MRRFVILPLAGLALLLTPASCHKSRRELAEGDESTDFGKPRPDLGVKSLCAERS